MKLLLIRVSSPPASSGEKSHQNRTSSPIFPSLSSCFSRKGIKILIIALFLLIFPLGQIVSINLGEGLRLQPIDLIALLSIPLYFSKLKKVVLYFLPILFGNFLWIFQNNLNILGLFYLLRFFSYVSFLFLIYDLPQEIKTKLPKFLILESLVIAIFGLLQYLFQPDLRNLKAFGWDDHYYRLIGTFLDPGFTGIILVLGFLLSLFFWIKSKRGNYFLVSIFLLICTALTYSRASFVALVMALGVISFLKKDLKILVFLLVLGGSILLLPRFASEGTELERTASINLRIKNYKETFEIFKKNPIFGVGVNNLCSARINYFNSNSFDSHSCSGSDSSVLYILATTGLIGMFIIVYYLQILIKRISLKDHNTQIIIVSVIVILVHSQFTNSLLYPWVLGWFAVLFGALRIKSIS